MTRSKAEKKKNFIRMTALAVACVMVLSVLLAMILNPYNI